VQNSTLAIKFGPAQVNVGSNSGLEAARLFQGNSTVNAVLNQTSLTVQNSTLSIVIGPASVAVGANVTLDSGVLFVGNSTVNAVVNSTAVKLMNSTSNALLSVPASADWTNGNKFLNANGSWTTPTATATPGGSNTQVQFNDSGSMGGDAGFTFDKVTDIATLANTLSVGNSTVNAVVNSTALLVQNSTVSTQAGPNMTFVGNSTVNSTQNSSSVLVQNSTMVIQLGPAQLNVGSNVGVESARFFVGNSTVNTIADQNGLVLSTLETTTPTAPTDSSMRIFSANIAGKPMPAGLPNTSVSRLANPMQSFLGGKAYMHFVVAWNTGGGTDSIGFSVANTLALTSRAFSTSNAFLSTKRLGMVTAAAAGSTCTVKCADLSHWRGNGAGLGGFLLAAKIGTAARTTGSRAFLGFKDSVTDLANGALTSQTNIIGIAFDSGDTAWKMISANATAANVISLGTGFPCNSNTVDMLDVVIFAPPNGGTVGYRVTNLKDGNVASGTFNQTNLPTTTTQLAWQVWVNSGSNGTATGVDLGSVYVETEF
jgi:hypothetical protein